MTRRVGLAMLSLAVAVVACTGPAGSAAPLRQIVEPSATASTDPLRLVVLGDSTAVPEVGCGACIGFDEQYAAYLETQTGRAVDLRNEAVPGDRIESLKSLLDTNTTVQVAIAKADIVVVSIGYNNGPPWDPDDPCHVQEVARAPTSFPRSWP